MKVGRLALLSVVFLGCQTLTAYAWHDRGHEVIAAIAWETMTPQARVAAVALLQAAPADAGIHELRPSNGSTAEQDRTQFVRAAVWADDVRTGPRKPRYHQPFWHFTDFFWEQLTPDSARRQRGDLPPHGELVTRLPALEASLRDLKNTPSVSPSKSTDLTWFLHLMGDIAQPLHCSGRITATEPAGDQGGNLFCVSPERGPDGRCLVNLHFFWDHVIEREFGDNVNLSEIATQIQTRHPRPAEVVQLRLGQYERWARTSQRLAARVAYPPALTRDAEPPAEYRQRVKRVSERVMALAGYRLGETLNQIFTAPSSPKHE